MPRKLEYADPNYHDDTVASNVMHREIELYHYELNMENYARMRDAATDPDLKNFFAKRIEEENKQYQISLATYNALKVEANKDPAKHAAAVTRVKAKNATKV